MVILKDTYEVKTEKSLARMVLFTGECDCDNFKGQILEGAVDTQQMKNEEPIKTTPVVLTDSRCLSYLNNAELEGIVENCGDGVIIIHIYQIETKNINLE